MLEKLPLLLLKMESDHNDVITEEDVDNNDVDDDDADDESTDILSIPRLRNA